MAQGIIGLAGEAMLAPAGERRQPAAGSVVPASAIRAVPWAELDCDERRAAWNALSAAVSEPNPFYESWFLLPSLRALDAAGTVQVLCFEQDGALRGLLPIRRETSYYDWPLPHLRGWVHDNCFLGVPLIAAGHEQSFWRSLLAWVDDQARLGLFLHLTHMPLLGPVHDALATVLGETGRASALVHREDRAMLAADTTPAAYLDTALSGKKRKELRRQYARLSEQGKLEFTRQEDLLGLGKWIDAFLELEHSGWKGAAGSALASHVTTETLFRDAVAEAARQGRLERLTLWLDQTPIAMLVNFLTPPGAYSFKTAFDERFARYSPGVLLQRENLDLLNRHEISWCDSCAAADHPMIDHLWRERRTIGRFSIAIGGVLRRTLFRQLARAELGRNPTGI